MDTETASHFISSLAQSIQALCHGYVQFSSSIEVIGHIYLKVDSCSKFNYIVNEEVNKNPDGLSTVFNTNSHQSLPLCCKCRQKPENKQNDVFIDVNESDTAQTNKPNVWHTDMISVPIQHQLNVHARSRDEDCQFQNQEPEDRPSTQSSYHQLPSTSSSYHELPSTSSSFSKSKHTISKRKSKKPNQVHVSALSNSEWIRLPSELDSVVVIEREPSTSPSHNSFVIENVNDENHAIEEGPTMEDNQCDDRKEIKVEGGEPFPITLHSELNQSVVHLHFGNNSHEKQEPSGSNVSTGNPKKFLSAQFRQRIVEYANIVGNRPAARQFGVHESSIRHWRKKFGLEGEGKRGRKRKRFLPQAMDDDLMIIARGEMDLQDRADLP